MQRSPWTLTLEADPDPSLRAKILEPLAVHNDAAAGPGLWGTLAVTVRGEDGEVVGGLWGRTGYGFLFVELLALGPARGLGLSIILRSVSTRSRQNDASIKET